MTPDVTETLSKRVRQLREERGLRLEDLASLSGLSHGTVARIERGDGGATIKTIAAIAAGLGVTWADLLDTDPQSVAS